MPGSGTRTFPSPASDCCGRMTRRPERGAPPAAGAAAPATATPEASAAWRGLLAAWAALAVLAAARGALAFVPSMAFWSLNLQRFLAPAAAWATWGLLAVALLPAVARRIT